MMKDFSDRSLLQEEQVRLEMQIQRLSTPLRLEKPIEQLKWETQETEEMLNSLHETMAGIHMSLHSGSPNGMDDHSNDDEFAEDEPRNHPEKK
ncbi:expressed unknown protein [Seminavis robusta]|uniref:Uncharacterized protein n=1 Tax=Seminavis robusta TaxID=568900 RepID=A0A9N8HPV2_9STRA|nr:expressed unknown protein [Seminavis robusta]|eukprot:Sro1105_g241940.1 n/a (93) ;mRNA; f:23287-23565